MCFLLKFKKKSSDGKSATLQHAINVYIYSIPSIKKRTWKNFVMKRSIFENAVQTTIFYWKISSSWTLSELINLVNTDWRYHSSLINSHAVVNLLSFINWNSDSVGVKLSFRWKTVLSTEVGKRRLFKNKIDKTAM